MLGDFSAEILCILLFYYVWVSQFINQGLL